MPEPTKEKRPIKIEKSRLLVVEGWNEYGFYYGFLRYLGLKDAVQVLTAEGGAGFASFIPGLPSATGFSGLASLGVIRDAEDSPDGAFLSLTASLKKAGLPVPSRPEEWCGTTPRVGILIQPGKGQKGMLETLLLQAVAEDAAFACIDPFLQCLEEKVPEPTRNKTKAKAQAFLASRKKAGLTIGTATEAGYWDLDHSAYDGTKTFLKSL